MADARCDRTDLLVDQCACTDHRGGASPQEEADAETLTKRADLIGHRGWFAATYAGTCGCGRRFEVGAAIAFNRYSDTNFTAECCAVLS